MILESSDGCDIEKVASYFILIKFKYYVGICIL